MGSSQARHLDLRGSMRLLYYSAPQAHSSNLGREVVLAVPLSETSRQKNVIYASR